MCALWTGFQLDAYEPRKIGVELLRSCPARNANSVTECPHDCGVVREKYYDVVVEFIYFSDSSEGSVVWASLALLLIEIMWDH